MAPKMADNENYPENKIKHLLKWLSIDAIGF